MDKNHGSDYLKACTGTVLANLQAETSRCRRRNRCSRRRFVAREDGSHGSPFLQPMHHRWDGWRSSSGGGWGVTSGGWSERGGGDRVTEAPPWGGWRPCGACTWGGAARGRRPRRRRRAR
ncbi:hypothetical protein SEVIR_8G119160v4 [Setaria viridis]